MKLIAGLGNPGEKYRGTRHNVGFDVLDELARRHGLTFESAPAEALQSKWRSGPDVAVIVKPLTFMNLSGTAVAALCHYYRIALPDVLVICDDVNLDLGRLRVRPGGSEGGHNGLRSVAEHLGTTEYPRLRIGVGRGDKRRNLADHVLARFEAEERSGVDGAVTRAADAVETWVSHGTERAMQAFNRTEHVE